MKSKTNTKLNDGCIKIFKLLLLLYEDKADYDTVLGIFKDDLKEEQSTNNIQVVLNKYINTLRVFGIKIKKENNKFQLNSSLYSMNFSQEDLKSISILINSTEKFPNEKICTDLNNIIKNLFLRMKNEDKNKLSKINKNYDFSFFYSNLWEQIEQCEKICAENFVINVLYLKNNKEVKCKCTPKEILYEVKNVYLQVYDMTKNENINIPISNILQISKLPQVAKSGFLTTTVVYKLKNRLAKSYKLKGNEHSDGYDKNGNLIVVNKNEPFEVLLKRLMRYSTNCEIVSPKYLREKMINLINETLNNYIE